MFVDLVGENQPSPSSRLKTEPLLNNFSPVSGGSVTGGWVIPAKNANHDHRYSSSSSSSSCRISYCDDLGSTWSAGRSQPHVQKDTELQSPDKHKDQSTVSGASEPFAANGKSEVFSSEVLYYIVKPESLTLSTEKSATSHFRGEKEKREAVVKETSAMQGRRYSTRTGTEVDQDETEVQQTAQNIVEENVFSPEKLTPGRNKVTDSAYTKSSPQTIPSSGLVSRDTEELINSPTKGLKRLSETPSESQSPKRYFTRGHRVDTSMLRKQNKAKDERKALKSSSSSKSPKVPRKQGIPDMAGTKNQEETGNEDAKVLKQGSISSGKEKAQVFLLNQLPDDIKAAIASASKTTTIGKQQVIYMNQMPESVKQFLESRSSVKSSEAKSRSLDFSELPETLKRLLPSTSQRSSISVKFLPSFPEGTDRGSSFIDGGTVESCQSQGDLKGIPSTSPNSKTPIVQAGTTRAFENSSKSQDRAPHPFTELTKASQDSPSKVYETQTDRKPALPIYKSRGIQIPAESGTTQTIPTKITPASSDLSASSDLTEQSKVVLRKYPALPLPNFLDKRSCYIPSIEVGLSFTDVGLVVERASLRQKTKELSQTDEKMSYKFSPNTHVRGKENAQKEPEISGAVSDLESNIISSKVLSEPDMDPNSRPVLNEVETLKADKRIEAIELRSVDGVTVIANKSMTCSVCGVRYIKPEKLAAHIMFSHYKYKCEICYSVLTEKDALLNHLKSIHNVNCQPKKRATAASRREARKCGHCNKRFANRGKLDSHQHKSHGAVIRCRICDKICTDIYRLTSHINVRHLRQGAAVCDICGKEFPVERYMNSHRRRHFQEKKHACPTCGKKFLDTNTLKDHIETHKPTEDRRYRYICSFCGKQFNSKRSFIDHTNVHTGSRPHVCKKCGKSFSYLTILRKHEKLKHDDRKPFECELCSKAFKMKANLQAHMVTHTGISKFTCPFCRRCFGTGSICKTHVSKCKASKALKHDTNPNAEAVQAMQMSVVTNFQSLAEDNTLVEAMQMAFVNPQTEELHPTDKESVEVAQETFMYMCSACSQTFDNIAAAELHINQCQGATSSQEIWCEQDSLQ